MTYNTLLTGDDSSHESEFPSQTTRFWKDLRYLMLHRKYRPDPGFLGTPWAELEAQLKHFNINPKSPNRWLSLSICLLEKRNGKARPGPKQNPRDDAVLAAIVEREKRRVGSYRAACKALSSESAWVPFLEALLPKCVRSGISPVTLRARAAAGRKNEYVQSAQDRWGDEWPAMVIQMFRAELKRKGQTSYPDLAGQDPPKLG